DGDRQTAAELTRIARHVELLDPVGIDSTSTVETCAGDRVQAWNRTAIEVRDRYRPPRHIIEPAHFRIVAVEHNRGPRLDIENVERRRVRRAGADRGIVRAGDAVGGKRTCVSEQD